MKLPLERWGLAAIALGCVCALSAQSQPQADEELQFVVIVSRHGVRSPTGKIDQLNQYSAQPWPEWSVPPGYLTAHGAKLMTLFGAYDRELLSQQGLLISNGCADARSITIIADSDQRTRETGKALAAGLMYGCSLEVRSLAEGTPDPLFHSLGAGVGQPDKLVATAAIAGRIGANPEGLAESYRTQLDSLERVLSGTGSGKNQAIPKPKLSLLDIPSSIAPGKGDHLVDLRGPLSSSSTMVENLMLEYAEGMDLSSVGWGRVDIKALRDLLQLHTASADLERRTNYLARVQASNLLNHILLSLQQASSKEPVNGALGRSSDRLLVLVGHDTNLANISGDLGLSWLIDGRRDDTPPGGALIVELWKKRVSSELSVRIYYTAQSLDQMRNATQLSLKNPPERVPVFLPGCSRADYSCEWKAFQATIRAGIDPDYIK